MDAADNFGLFINILTFIDLVLWLLGYVRLREQIKELEEALNDVTDELDKALGMGFSTDNLQVRFHKLREETSVLFREVDFEKTLYGEAWSILLGMNWEIFRLTKELKLLLLAVMIEIETFEAAVAATATAAAAAAAQQKPLALVQPGA